MPRTRGLLLRPQGLVHGLVLRVLHGVLVHLVEVRGMVMVVMKMVVHDNTSVKG